MVHRRIQHFEILQYPYATFIDGDPLAENTGLSPPIHAVLAYMII